MLIMTPRSLCIMWGITARQTRCIPRPLLHSGRPHRCVVGYHPGVVDQHVYPAPRPDDLLGDPGCVIVSGNVQG